MDTVEIFDPTDYTLRIMTTRLPQKYHGIGLIQIRNKILALGGMLFPGWAKIDPVYEFDPISESFRDTGLKTPVAIAPNHVKIYND